MRRSVHSPACRTSELCGSPRLQTSSDRLSPIPRAPIVAGCHDPRPNLARELGESGLGSKWIIACGLVEIDQVGSPLRDGLGQHVKSVLVFAQSEVEPSEPQGRDVLGVFTAVEDR